MSTGAPEGAERSNKMLDLSVKIEKSECYARNESDQYPMTNLFIGDSRLGCKSDADEQIIIHVAFNEFVKVRTLMKRQNDVHDDTLVSGHDWSTFFICSRCTNFAINAIRNDRCIL